ncbi:MAG: hypothetical protein ACI9NG_002427, partial [Hyphomonas sp.]
FEDGLGEAEFGKLGQNDSFMFRRSVRLVPARAFGSVCLGSLL